MSERRPSERQLRAAMGVGRSPTGGTDVERLVIEAAGKRILPQLTPENRPFFTGGANGELLVQRCAVCRRWVHPPTDRCAACGGELRPEPVSGKGTVFAFTVNEYQFHPDVLPPNTIAIVELVEQDDLRIATNLVGCDDAELRCGLPVHVLFERHGEIFFPLFEPVRRTG